MTYQNGDPILYPGENFDLDEVLNRAGASKLPHILVIWNIANPDGSIIRYGDKKDNALLCFMDNDKTFADQFGEALATNGTPHLMTACNYAKLQD